MTQSQHSPSVSRLVQHSFAIAQARYHEEYVAWVNLSGRLAGRSLIFQAAPDIQRLGDIDLVLRCMEGEHVTAAAVGTSEGMLAFHYQKMFSELWIGGWYEILRAIRQRANDAARRSEKTSGLETSEEFKSLLFDFERLRVPLEKYEIPKDKNLSEPLKLKRYPPNDDDTDDSVYDKDDPQRSHVMPSGISDRASLRWMVLDHASGREYWVERRSLSDRLLALASHETMK